MRADEMGGVDRKSRTLVLVVTFAKATTPSLNFTGLNTAEI